MSMLLGHTPRSLWRVSGGRSKFTRDPVRIRARGAGDGALAAGQDGGARERHGAALRGHGYLFFLFINLQPLKK